MRELEIPWEFLDKEVDDRGSYFLLLHLARRRRLQVGQLGSILFEKGHYVYAGSAMANLGARLARHCRRRKRMHWHVDYLRQAAGAVVPVPVRASRRLECELACGLEAIMGAGVPGFGCSDCECRSHLFRSEEAPLDRRDFHELLQRYRMPRPPG